VLTCKLSLQFFDLGLKAFDLTNGSSDNIGLLRPLASVKRNELLKLLHALLFSLTTTPVDFAVLDLSDLLTFLSVLCRGLS